MVGALAALVVVGAFSGLCWLLLQQRRASSAVRSRADRLTSFLLALSRANRAVLRMQDEESLWGEACRLFVETGQAVLACV